MKKVYLIRTVKIISLLLAVILVVTAANYLLFFNKRDVLRLDGLRLEEENSLDVLLIGASEVYTAFSSPYAYELEGFTSYPYAVASCPVTLWKTMLEDALTRQTPQLIVVEISGVTYYSHSNLHNNTAMHYVLDGMPLTLNKIRTVNRLCGEDTDGRSTFFLPIIKYHSVWQNAEDLETNYLDKTLQHRRGYALLRGVSSTPAAPPPPDGVRDLSGDRSENELAEEAEQYLTEFLQYCRDKGLNVLFTSFPHQAGVSDDNAVYDNYKRKNRAESIIRDYGFPFLNLERTADQLGIDPEHDYYNVNHLNLYGQKKVTEFFSKYLVEEFGVTPRLQNQAVEEGWKASAEYYKLYCDYVEKELKKGYPDPNPIAETAKTISILDEIKAKNT